MSEQSVLALYDFRGKQEFIYRTNQMKEVSGASRIIAKGYEKLLEIAQDSKYFAGKGIYSYNKEPLSEDAMEQFSIEQYRQHIEDGYIGEVIYEGGGNMTILFKDETTCKRMNRIFTTQLIRDTYSLKALCTYIPVNLDEDNYTEDYKRLRQKHARMEGLESVIAPCNTLPFVQVDNVTSFPLVSQAKRYGQNRKVSRESELKLQSDHDKRRNDNGRGKNIYELDDMVTDKGTESLLAVIFIDGNNMGERVASSDNALSEDYKSRVNHLRRFSYQINQVFVVSGMNAVDDALIEGSKENKGRRTVVAAGDEITIICNARDAYRVVKAYLEDIYQQEGEYSSCAGIAIFNSHAPFSDVYRIAEECCESGKKRMKRDRVRRLKRSCLMDFHYCQNGIGVSLDAIREEIGEDKISRPWVVAASEQDKDNLDFDDIFINKEKDHLSVEVMRSRLKKIERTNIKSLAEHAFHSKADFERELLRIEAHAKDEVKLIREGEDWNLARRLIYDMILVYDLWFREEDEVTEDGGDRT